MYPSQQTNQKIARPPSKRRRSDVCVRIWSGVRVRSSFSSCVCFPAAVASAARVRFLRRGDVLPRGDARELELRGGKDAQRSSSRAQEALDPDKENRRTSCAMLTTRKKETNQQRYLVVDVWFQHRSDVSLGWALGGSFWERTVPSRRVGALGASDATRRALTIRAMVSFGTPMEALVILTKSPGCIDNLQNTSHGPGSYPVCPINFAADANTLDNQTNTLPWLT